MRCILPCLLSLFIPHAPIHSTTPDRPASTPALTLHAGAQDRFHCSVTVQLPESLRAHAALRDPQGGLIDLQVDAQGTGTFLEPNLSRGQSKTYRFVRQAPQPAAPPAVQCAILENRARLEADPLPAFFLQTRPGPLPRADIPAHFARGAYLHPIHTPSGRRVTDDYPANHIHHHGAWFSWTKTQFKNQAPDFWNMGQQSGTVEFAGVIGQWTGPVHGGITTRHHFRELLSPDRTVVLDETWTVRAYRADPGPKSALRFDIESVQTCATPDPLILPPYHYGGMAFRGHWDWNGATKAFWLTSEGVTDRVQANETRARWCYIGGRVDGQQAGIVVLGHPNNFRAPQPLRIHPTEPYFCFTPQQLGAMEIAPGQPYVSKYRYLVVDGPPDRDWIERQYDDYATPPQVTLQP